MANWSRVQAVMGGTFDPPHYGHVEAVRGILKSPGVAKVSILPNASPPQKDTQSTAEQRWQLCEAAFLEEDARVELLDLELKSDGTNYTVDTLRQLKTRSGPSQEIAFVIGTDQLLNLESWRGFPELLRECHWIVLRRAGVAFEPIMAKINQWLESGVLSPSPQDGLSDWQTRGETTLALFPTKAPEVSSSEVRAGFKKKGLPPDGTVPYQVERMIQEMGLYR
jgi:nicotinate-nucleotide adenylyltransferase